MMGKANEGGAPTPQVAVLEQRVWMQDQDRRQLLEAICARFRKSGQRFAMCEVEMPIPTVWRSGGHYDPGTLDIRLTFETGAGGEVEEFDIDVCVRITEHNVLSAGFSVTDGRVKMVRFSDEKLGNLLLLYDVDGTLNGLEEFPELQAATDVWQEGIARERVDVFLNDFCQYLNIDPGLGSSKA